jgi:hypothetical protein
MAIIVQCDRCGEEVVSAQPTKVGIHLAGELTIEPVQRDLCATCADGLLAFLGGRELVEMADLPEG